VVERTLARYVRDPENRTRMEIIVARHFFEVPVEIRREFRR